MPDPNPANPTNAFCPDCLTEYLASIERAFDGELLAAHQVLQVVCATHRTVRVPLAGLSEYQATLESALASMPVATVQQLRDALFDATQPDLIEAYTAGIDRLEGRLP